MIRGVIEVLELYVPVYMHFLLLTFDDAVEFLIYMFNEKANYEREQLENKIKDNAEKLDSYLDKCNEDTIKFM